MADFDEIFRDMDYYFKKLSERMLKEMEEIEKAIRSGKFQGEWEVKPIEELGAKGYVARGRFQLGEPLTLPKRATEEVREPLTDVLEDKDHVKLYAELPGVEKNDIQLNATEGRAEVKAKNFYKVIDLPTRDIEFEKAIANYKNGVLEVMIPKTKKTVNEEKKKTIKIE
jgi:HSP20 family protein